MLVFLLVHVVTHGLFVACICTCVHRLLLSCGNGKHVSQHARIHMLIPCYSVVVAGHVQCCRLGPAHFDSTARPRHDSYIVARTQQNVVIHTSLQLSPNMTWRTRVRMWRCALPALPWGIRVFGCCAGLIEGQIAGCVITCISHCLFPVFPQPRSCPSAQGRFIS
jgi:hypothetical protein